MGRTGNIVSISLVRELGPGLTALLVAGRNASGIASELGSIKVTEQIDANTKYRGVSSWQEVHTGQPAVVISKDGGHVAAAIGQLGNRPGNGNFRRPSGVERSEEQVPAA